MKIILRGLPRSGTHLAEQWLLKKHFPEVEVDASNRHRLVDFANMDSDTRILVCFKHPMAWLVSMHRWVLGFEETGPVFVDGVKYETNSDFEYFLILNPTLYTYWKVSVSNWAMFDNTIYIDYDETLKDPQATVDFIGSKLKVEPTPLKSFPVDDLNSKTPFDFSYYLEKKWRLEYNRGLWEHCKTRFNKRLIHEMYLGWEEPSHD